MAEPSRILLVDDDDDFASSLTAVLEAHGYDVTHATNGVEGTQMAQAQPFDLVLTDFRMPQMGGMEVLQNIKAARPQTPIILMTAFSTTDRAIEATKAGAFDYLMKPFDPPELLATINRALSAANAAARLMTVNEAASGKDALVGHSRAMREIFKEIGRLAATPVPVLILGETGTGKELIARALHQHSNRAAEPFVAVNCAAIPETLIESELFGHEKGAFTHALSRRIGRFEQAQGGTLFLDEIGDLPASTQVKLLRVLQEKKVSRVGGTEEVALDVRITAATHRDISAMIQAGSFREDLYYRLNAVVLHLPPLRERPDDIAPLVRYFLTRSAKELGIAEPAVEAAALTVMEHYRWPGNVRQLENAVRRLLIDARGLAVTADQARQALEATPATSGSGLAPLILHRLSEARSGALPAGALPVLVEDLERELYTLAVEQAAGNQSQIAEWLGVSRVTVREKLDRFQLLPKRTRKE
jgi:nitrogen regulation protein NR(I)